MKSKFTLLSLLIIAAPLAAACRAAGEAADAFESDSIESEAIGSAEQALTARRTIAARQTEEAGAEALRVDLSRPGSVVQIDGARGCGGPFAGRSFWLFAAGGLIGKVVSDAHPIAERHLGLTFDDGATLTVIESTSPSSRTTSPALTAR